MSLALLSILDVFAARVATITTANGYRTDIGDNLTRGRFQVSEQTALPASALLLLPRVSEETSQGGDRSKVAAQIQIEGHRHYTTADSPEAFAIAMLADIQQAVEIAPLNLDGLLVAEGFSWAGDEIVYPEDVSNVVSAMVVYDIPHIRYTGDPEKPAP